MKRIAVEPSLSNISSDLQEYGFEVVDWKDENLKDIDAYVISGVDKNVMGMQGTSTRQPVINAQGMTSLEIRRELERNLYGPKEGN